MKGSENEIIATMDGVGRTWRPAGQIEWIELILYSSTLLRITALLRAPEGALPAAEMYGPEYS